MKKRTTMPVVLVNPSASGGRLKKRNPRRSKRRRGSKRRRRNPARGRNGGRKVTIGRALMATGIGMAGGVVAYGVGWGLDQTEQTPAMKAGIVGGAGILGSVGLAYVDERLAAGLAGGTAAEVARRGVEAYQLAQVGKNGTKNGATNGTTAEGGAVYQLRPRNGVRTEGGAVYERRAREAGAVRAFPMPSAATRTFKPESGASRYIPGPVRWYGPQSWAYGTEAGRGRKLVSAHNR
jgi:hypothetical protein